MKCPNCGTRLEQLGKAVNGLFYPENLYDCIHCPVGYNRFSVGTLGKLQPEYTELRIQ